MKIQDFLNLSEIEQQTALSQSGKIVINYLQGEINASIYKLNDMLVKVKLTEDSTWNVEVYNGVENIKLFEDKS